jgi:hypothetical protein
MVDFTPAFTFERSQSYQLIHGKQPVMPLGRQWVSKWYFGAKYGTPLHGQLPSGTIGEMLPFSANFTVECTG